MKMKNNFLKIPINRIIALLIMDTMSIIIASFAALYIRFDFQFNAIPNEYMLKFEHVLPFNIAFTLLFFVIWKLYKSVWRYASATEMLNIVFATCCASAAQLVFCHLRNAEKLLYYLFVPFVCNDLWHSVQLPYPAHYQHETCGYHSEKEWQ